MSKNESQSRASSLLHYLQHELQHYLLPNHCLLCHSLSPEALCLNCSLKLSRPTKACLGCDLRLNSEASFCPECQQGQHNFDQAYCAFDYEAELKQLIHHFKDKGQLRLGCWLSQELAQRLKQAAQQKAKHQQIDLMCPTPQHWLKRLKRGFNQAAFISKQLNRHLEIPLQICCLFEHKLDFNEQKLLNREQRQIHAAEPFTLKKRDIRGLNVAIVDDLITTAATANQLSRQLKRAGAARVEIWALARTPKPNRQLKQARDQHQT
ncbi:ComF family protein [Agaribacterium sp. ZY112]|uniref:ComF family protein n=1 Tax=Agaribacterium sp. ZY112 TaxID=3233574 RepID=UPI0035268682